MGHDAKDSKYRFQWTFPIMNSPFDPNVLYVGSNVVFKSTNKGKDWQIISPDLTKHHPATLGPRRADQQRSDVDPDYATVFALQESPITPGCCGPVGRRLIHVTRDGGKTWKDVTPKGLPPWTRISIIDPSPHSAGTAWSRRSLSARRLRATSKTTDYGATWTRINDGIRRSVHALDSRGSREAGHAVRVDRAQHVGVARRRRALGESQANLPPVPVHDIALRDDDIVIATHGRAFWVMENLALLVRRRRPKAAARPARFPTGPRRRTAAA